jgi:hypothetical protein
MQTTKKIIFLFALMFFTFLTSYAQEKKITGKVISSSGKVIEGASIQAKSSKRTTITDASGNFSLSVENSDNEVTVKSLGFVTKTIAINSNKLSITLIDDTKEMEEVVVTALGIKKDKKIT